jgi:hypothetical protein
MCQVSIRSGRALVGLVAAAVALAALPAPALAAGEGLTVTPASTQAGGLVNVTATLSFAVGDTPKTVVTSLAPGMLGNLNANPGCLLTQQLTSACQIGTASVSTTASPTPFTGNLYVVPPAQNSGDAAGVELVPSSGPLTNQYFGVTLNPNAPGGLNLTTTFPNPISSQITGFTANFTTLNGQEFTRLPSSCSAAVSSASVTYYGSTAPGSATSSFTPTGCASLPYAPGLTGAITRDKSDRGATLTFGITQAAGEAASKTIALTLPKGLSVNVQADITCLTGSGSGCDVGSASATSPLVPSVALANGAVKLGGSAIAPAITIAFPAPFAITLAGTVNLTNGSVTFANVPDVPLTALTVKLTGPNGKKAFTTSCAPGSVGSTFTSQSGVTKTATASVKFTGCPTTASGSTAGLANGHPKLKFKITKGTGAANIATLALGAPSGLKFSRSAIVSRKTCTTKGKKKKCTTTTLIKGLLVTGAKAKSVAIKGGRLVITLKKPAGKVTITVGGPLVTETKAVQTKVKKRKLKTLKFTLKITDAKRAASTVSLKLKAH